MDNLYGNLSFTKLNNDLELHIENVTIRGYTILRNVINEDLVTQLKQAVQAIYDKQEKEFGEDNLIKIQDVNIARCILKYDYELFKQLAFNNVVIDLVQNLLKQKFMLGLQNAIINRGTTHRQSSWHRDLPYQNFLCNEILSINALWALDNFNAESGGTCLLPYSMNFINIPSKEFVQDNLIQPILMPGDIMIFNSLLLHKAGTNTGRNIRVSINHQYIRPFINPQYKFSEIPEIKCLNLSNFEKDILGFNFPNLTDDIAWRNNRMQRILHDA
ncbi:MAG: hypothetical protein K0R49_448 [Burkholderiales bacterium]|jgi:ectoine hydroxylase-related dioxygenase (phytanoyl-CoA dioxygenase family)|nr:hypothetical protein [Burkholderiales bacterium]MCE3268196.1 hypothetical protein [Burkholderiales bacterium]